MASFGQSRAGSGIFSQSSDSDPKTGSANIAIYDLFGKISIEPMRAIILLVEI
jgi:hypothetical protein